MQVQALYGASTSALRCRYKRSTVHVQALYGAGTSALRCKYRRSTVQVQALYGASTCALRCKYKRSTVQVQALNGACTSALPHFILSHREVYTATYLTNYIPNVTVSKLLKTNSNLMSNRNRYGCVQAQINFTAVSARTLFSVGHSARKLIV